MKPYNILILDDRAQTRNSLKDKLESSNQALKIMLYNGKFDITKISEADEVWELKKGEIDAIIVDIMFPSIGLTENERLKTKGGLLTGWVWLWEHLNPHKLNPHPAAHKCLVVYSAYLSDLEDYIKNECTNEDEKAFFASAKCVFKGEKDDIQPRGGREAVLNHLIEDMNKK